MDVIHGPIPTPASVGATNPPPRPAIPPKPDKDKIGSRGNAGTSNFRNSSVGSESFSPPASGCHPQSARTPAAGSDGCRISYQGANPITKSSSAVLNPPSVTAGGPSPNRKPALPPKPLTTNLSSPPLTTRPPPVKPPPLKFSSHSVDNSKFSNENATVNGQNGFSPPSVLRRPPSLSPRLPLSPNTSRPNSTFLSSPINNLNSVNFPSTTGLNNGNGITSPTRREAIRVKSASLGRNITFPFSDNSSGGGGGIRGIINRKSATLAKFLPLDLHIGSGPRPPPVKKPNSLNLNPFIQAQMSQQQVQGHPILNFGKSIAFSPESPLPPPPPPRLKKKLSPVNSLSPSSPTSPMSPGMNSLAPNGPLPLPPPFSPNISGMEALQEGEEAGAIYAEVDKEKKWAERKLKDERRTSAPNSSSNFTQNSSQNKLNGNGELSPKEERLKDDENQNINESEIRPEIVDSWLGRYLSKNTVNSNQSADEEIRSATPTYQSTKTGHIYETIGENADNANNNNNNEKTLPKGQEDEELNDNQSFLFKLVIGHMKPVGTETEGEVGENVDNLEDNVKEDDVKCKDEVKLVEENLSLDDQQATCQSPERIKSILTLEEPTPPPPPPPRLFQLAQNGEKSGNSYLIPTVIQQTTETEKAEGDAELDVSFAEPEVNLASPLAIVTDAINTLAVASVSPLGASVLRRRSWNCDRVDNHSPCPSSDSSSVTSSNSYLPYHRRERSYGEKSNRDSLLSRDDWVDEGELSNGALADAESSSDIQQRSSAEDVSNIKGATIPTASSNTKGFASRRSRLVNSIFGSFGKGSSSSSGGGSGRKLSGLRYSGGSGGKRNKEKSQSTFFQSDSSNHPHPPRRQISDSVIISGPMISGPIHPNSTQIEVDFRPNSHKTSLVQFSPEVSQTRIIYHERELSSDSNLGGVNSTLISSPQLPLPQLEGGRAEDTESVSSSESVSVCGSGTGSVSGYEDILADLSPKEKKSFYVAREILTSERTFVDVLNLLTKDFPKFLSSAIQFHGAPVITNEDLESILGGLPNLKRVNEDLLTDLEERISKWKESPKIADILVKKGPFLKLYATYIKDFQKNSMTLDNCCQKYPLFAATIREFEASDRCQKLGLKHYMLKPVQRMPQYRLLLEDYLKSLEKDSEDYEDTIKGIAIVKDVAEHANEAIRLQVNAEKLLHLQNRLSTGTIILKSDRQLMKEGELDKVCRKELQTRFFALMNDCLFCFTYHAAAGSPKDLRMRYELPLAGMRVSLSPNEDYKNEFSVISITRSFNLVAKSSKEREEWMKALNSAINDNIKKRTCSTPDLEMGFQLGKEAPVWIQDSRVTMCQLCTAEFTVTFRRHHCRACGKVVCGNCSGNQAPLQYLQNASSRVCDSCYEHLLEEFDNQSDLTQNDSDRHRSSIREKFKKVTPNVSKRATKIKRTVPARLEVNANSSGSRMNGYLQWREKEKKSWKRRWFVLIDRVLYIYAASEDIVAIKSIPLLGWQVELDKAETPDNDENQASFRLTHLGHPPIHFQADCLTVAEKWIAAMSEAVVL